jgi:hypothetical protein
MNLFKKLISGLLYISLLITVVVGCASKPTLQGFFNRESKRLNSPERRLLVETLRVLVLLEEYHEALEAKDIDTLIACYSPNYSHYDKGLDGQEELIRERYFSLFGELSVSFRDIEIEFIRKETGYWMRQEDFDWLRAREALPAPIGSYLILFETTTGSVELVLGESSSACRSGDSHGPGKGESDMVLNSGSRKVTVRSSIDREVDRSMGEVSFRILLKGELAGCDGSEVFTSSLEEKVILLLEKEEGEWKIISQW